jgi:hypothetical protein
MEAAGGEDERTLVDSMKLAYEAFQGSRHRYSQGDMLLDTLSRTLSLVRQSDALVVEVPSSWVRALDPYFLKAIRPDAEGGHAQVSWLSEGGRRILSFLELGAIELGRMWSSGSPDAAIRSVGYALHNMPGLVLEADEGFDPEQFSFCFRIVAFHWCELSAEFQRALCALMGMEQARAEALMSQPDFAIDMFPRTQKRES